MTKTMRTLTKANEKALSELPERLQRLQRELAIERTKDFDNDLYAVRREYRFRVSVFRHPTEGFVATTKAAGHVHRYNGATPVDAFIKLTRSLDWLVVRLDFEKNQALREARQWAEAA